MYVYSGWFTYSFDKINNKLPSILMQSSLKPKKKKGIGTLYRDVARKFWKKVSTLEVQYSQLAALQPVSRLKLHHIPHTQNAPLGINIKTSCVYLSSWSLHTAVYLFIIGFYAAY